MTDGSELNELKNLHYGLLKTPLDTDQLAEAVRLHISHMTDEAKPAAIERLQGVLPSVEKKDEEKKDEHKNHERLLDIVTIIKHLIGHDLTADSLYELSKYYLRVFAEEDDPEDYDYVFEESDDDEYDPDEDYEDDWLEDEDEEDEYNGSLKHEYEDISETTIKTEG